MNLEPKDLISAGIALLALWQSWRAGQIAKQEALRREVSDNTAKINLLWQIVQGQLALNLKHNPTPQRVRELISKFITNTINQSEFEEFRRALHELRYSDDEKDRFSANQLLLLLQAKEDERESS